MPPVLERLQTPQEAFVIRTTEMVRQYRAKLEHVTTETERNVILEQLQEWEQQLHWGGKTPPEVNQVRVLQEEIMGLKAHVMKLLGIRQQREAPEQVEESRGTAS